MQLHLVLLLEAKVTSVLGNLDSAEDTRRGKLSNISEFLNDLSCPLQLLYTPLLPNIVVTH